VSVEAPALTTGSLASRVPRALFERRLSRSLFGVARTWVGIALCWWAVGALGWWAVLPAVLLIGTLQYHLNVLGHDGLHYLLSNSRPINDFLCRWLLHGPHGAPLGAMRRNHLNHHTQFGSAADLDRQYYDTTRFTSRRAFRRWLFGALVGGMTLPIVFKLLGRKATQPAATLRPAPAKAANPAIDLASVVLSQAWIAAAAWLFTGWWFGYAVLWLLPLLTVMVGLNSIRSCLEHARSGSPAPGLHSFRSDPIERFFLSPFNMNVHAEHHLVPAVPWHQLPALRAHLQSEGLYGEVGLFASYRARAAQLAAATETG
jgi:fatty acid desaturase